MNRISITVPVYLYKPYATWMLGIYCFLLLCLFIFSAAMKPWMVATGAAILLGLPVYAVLKPKSFFSIRSWDERKLTIGTDLISWDGAQISVKDLTGLEIYIFSFDNFHHLELSVSEREVTVTEYGDQNKINFRYLKDNYDFTFYLADFEQYNALVEIISTWQADQISFSARSAFEDSYIREQVHLDS